jgi:hypothetical protein
MKVEVRVGLIAGGAQILAALIALVGTLATAESKTATSGAGSDTSATSAPATPLADGSRGDPCTTVVERYRSMIERDARIVAVLTTEGPDGISPVEADPDARRCGLSEDALRELETMAPQTEGG